MSSDLTACHLAGAGSPNLKNPTQSGKLILTGFRFADYTQGGEKILCQRL
jgi:hypothetical protein